MHLAGFMALTHEESI